MKNLEFRLSVSSLLLLLHTGKILFSQRVQGHRRIAQLGRADIAYSPQTLVRPVGGTVAPLDVHSGEIFASGAGRGQKASSVREAGTTSCQSTEKCHILENIVSQIKESETVRGLPASAFSGSSHTSDLNKALRWLPCQASGVIGSALELVGPVSVYCD